VRTQVSPVHFFLIIILHNRLPKLQAEIIDLHERCLSQLRALPPRVSDDPSGHLTAMINKFCNQLSSLVRGAPAMESLVQANLETYLEFCEKIKSTAPIFHASLRSASTVEDLDEGSTDTLVMYLDDVHDHIKKLVHCFRLSGGQMQN
jgi:hypothetical protein